MILKQLILLLGRRNQLLLASYCICKCRASPFRSDRLSSFVLKCNARRKSRYAPLPNVFRRGHYAVGSMSATNPISRTRSVLVGERNVCLRPNDSVVLESRRPRLESVKIVVPTTDDMEEIAALLASMIFLTDNSLGLNSVSPTAGYSIFLDGDLGAGKTVFAGGFIRWATGNLNEKVTSPTYLLSTTYHTDSMSHHQSTKIHHLDLYRLNKNRPEDFRVLDLDHIFSESVALVEWSVRLPEYLIPEDRLEVKLTIQKCSNYTKGNENLVSEEETLERVVDFVPHGKRWKEIIQAMVNEGYLDDLLL